MTQRLRAHGVTGRFVEFLGPAVATMSVPERATLANMAPEYGATVAFFPVDGQAVAYLRITGRDATHVARVEAYCRANALWREADDPAPCYSEEIIIDLTDAVPTLAGPKRPQDRLPLATVAADFRARLARSVGDGGFGIAEGEVHGRENSSELAHGRIVVAAITSYQHLQSFGDDRRRIARCAQRGEAGNAPAIVGQDFAGARLAGGDALSCRDRPLTPLEALGFHVIGYGCTTCGGKSGPLSPAVAEAIERDGLVVTAVLSGNRNFEGRIHRLARANYLGSPPLVVAYALAGRIDIDLTREPLGHDRDGRQYTALADLTWPDESRSCRASRGGIRSGTLHGGLSRQRAWSGLWRELATTSERFAWDPASSYLVEPPFVAVSSAAIRYRNARGCARLATFGDLLTTDHISPSSEIPVVSAAGRYLASLGIAPAQFNTYVGRRCNHEVMARGTFANIRIRNLLVPQTEGGITRKFPEGTTMSMFDAARAYRDEGTPLLVIGGCDYGAGSSRDWAAKGSALLGVRAVLAESYERIHRANLVSMGVVPLRFTSGEGLRSLGLRARRLTLTRSARSPVLDGTPVAVRPWARLVS